MFWNHQALIDMGFARDQCVQALLFSSSMEQATEFLLSSPPTVLRTPNPTVVSAGGGRWQVAAASAAAVAAAADAAMDTDGNDDDAVMRAIALSLTADPERVDETVEKEQLEHVLQSEPLNKNVLDNFVEQALAGCLSLLDALPETVYRVCSVAVAMVQRNGNAYRDAMLASLAEEIATCVCALQVKLD